MDDVMTTTRARQIEASVRAHYDRHVEQEWLRLSRHRVEFAVTLRALRDTLAPASRVLDVGGGPGRYAVALAVAGHRVTLLDLSPRLLDRARDHARDRRVRLEDYVEGNAVDLARFDNGSFDAVLLFGPLYHLPAAEDRLRALREAHRVLAPGGALLAAFVTRYGPLRDLARAEPGALIKQARRYETLLEAGVFPDADDRLANGYYARWEEVAPLLATAGFAAPRLLAVESILERIEDRVGALRGPAWEAWADLAYDLADDPGLLAACSHLLAIAQRGE